ncbi:PAS domain-containing sensor histidine kinase [Mucilaginibacter gynuensis]
MDQAKLTTEELLAEMADLRIQLEEANDTIQAIRTGQVDAFVLKGENGHELYTLKTADQTYRVFIEKMNEGAVTLNREGVILYSNSRFAAMVSSPLEKVAGTTFDRFISDDELDKFARVIGNGWEEDCKQEINLTAITGEIVPCLLSCNALELDEGMALSLILTDLTIQKNAEKQLQLKNDELAIAHNAAEKMNDELEDIVKERTSELLISREHFKLLANNIPQMTWTSLPTGELNFYNRQWYDYTGLDLQHEREYKFEDIVHPDDLEITNQKYNAAIESGNIFEVENRYRKGTDGSYRWHLNRAIPLWDEAGHIILWVGTATDIEEQKQQMQRKDEFIGIASHELKTPLTSLKGYLQLLGTYKKDVLPPTIKTYIEKANLASNKLQHLVNDLLDVSKIQAGRLEYQFERFDISKALASCIENARHIYPDNIFYENVQPDIIISGNAERLEQVVMNFINNAVKYSQDDKRIIITTERLQGYLRVSVTDFGIGMSKKEIGRVFERFYRVEDMKFMASGLGMGLYISTEIINSHKGKIGVDSELGKGSTFYFDLPL